MSGTIAVRIDYGRSLLDDGAASKAVGEVLSRPCFSAFHRVSGRTKDRWSKHAEANAERNTRYLSDPAIDAVSLETKREDHLAASAEIENGLHGRSPSSPATGMQGYVVIPFAASNIEAVVKGASDLAVALQAGAGFIALEPDYRAAKRLALNASRPQGRDGVSDDRLIARRGRAWKSDLIATHIAAVEWGTFLGGGHLARIDLAAVRTSGAFARIVEVAPDLVLLLVTEDPRDDVSGELEKRLPAARAALAPILMDLRDVNLD
jgi:hypothetical protein